MTILFGFAAFSSIFLGGLLALKFRDKLHLFIGFSAGAVIGLVFFDLLPEAIKLGSPFYPISFLTLMSSIGFIIYMFLDRMALLHSHVDEVCQNPGHGRVRGFLGAGSLSLHSFLDGVAIGLAFHVSTNVGIVVTAAIIVHGFSDGINTVSIILKNGGEKRLAFRWLLTDAVAPVLGLLTTFFFTIPEKFLGLMLAILSGFFLYIGASDLLPESHHAHPTKWTTFTTLLGIVVIYIVVWIAGV